MNSKIKKYTSPAFLGITLLLFSTSCNDFLEETDPSNFTQDTYFTQPKHAESIVNAIYADLRSTTGGSFGGAPWMMLEFATGLANTDLGQAQNSINIRNLANNSDNTYGGTYWTSSYKGIANANLAIINIPGITMDENQKKRLIGEAQFLRAYYYFNLVRIFGQIPLITEPVGLASEALYPAKVTEEEVYNLIVADLVAAEAAGLPATDKSGKVTTGAIKSLLSSVYLTMAGFPLNKGTEYYQKAAAKAQEVISSGAYSLFTAYNDLHNEATENSGEHILMVQFAPFLISSNWQTSIIPYNKGISAYSDETGAIYANTDFVQTYEPGDKRIKEKEFYFNEYTLSSDRNATINLGGYFIYKHFDPKAQLETTNSGLNWMLMRYAEVLLIYAEAANEVSGPTAESYAAINQIRKRAELPELQGLSQELFREAIWREKWHELSYENKTWFDMVRLRKAFNVKTKTFDDYVGHQFSYGPVLKERELLFPIPTAEVRNNKNLVQNTGY